jgi:hypothetical protein
VQRREVKYLGRRLNSALFERLLDHVRVGVRVDQIRSPLADDEGCRNLQIPRFRSNLRIFDGFFKVLVVALGVELLARAVDGDVEVLQDLNPFPWNHDVLGVVLLL